MKKKLLTILVFVLFCFFVIRPVLRVHAAENTTIIALDPNKDYQKGEVVKVTVGISSTDGSYLKSADCGFGYNGATMKLLTETESVDHFYVESETPAKWMYYTMEFEMINDGKMYFIAGAYSGDGVIKAIKANGSRIDLPRASVVYKIGTGIYTKVSDCNLGKAELTTSTGSEIELNRAFNENINEYWATVDSSVSEINFNVDVENKDDKVILPDGKLEAGENIKDVYVEATDGVRKTYTFHITRPEQPFSLSNIKVTTNDGTEIPYDFDENTTEYYLEIDSKVDKLTFTPESEYGYMKYNGIGTVTLKEGYVNLVVTAATDSETREYHYNIFRKYPELAITSLIGELSDDTILKFDQEFDPDIYDYTAKCTSDIKKVKFVYSLADDDEYLKDDAVYTLDEGANICNLVVTDGANEKTYKVTIFKDAYDVTEKEKEENKPFINNRTIQSFIYKSKWPLAVVGIIILVGFIGVSAKQITGQVKDFDGSEEQQIIEEEEDRKRRLKEIKKKRKEEQERRNKDKK